MLAQILTMHGTQIKSLGVFISSKIRRMQTRKRRDKSRSFGNHRCFDVKQQSPPDDIAATGRPIMKTMVMCRE